MRRALLLLAALAPLVSAACGDDDGTNSADGSIPGVEILTVTSNRHTEATVAYDQRPPVGGDHDPAAAPCGFFGEVIAEEHIVHSLEHGAVWLAYRPDLPAADLAVIRALTEEYEDTLATPYPDLEADAAVVATAWARQLELGSVGDPRLERFVDLYRKGNQAPEGRTGCPRAEASG